MRRSFIRWVLAVSGLAAVTAAGLTACTASGGDGAPALERGIFHGRWWNYYERGSLRLAAADYAGAESDFKSALRSRSRDAWRARTYGLHFSEYFANRELGIALFHEERYAEAETVLRTALAMVDTERCRYYLEKTLRERLSRGELTDAAPPKIALESDLPATGSAHIVTVRLTARDDTGLAEVKLNGRPLLLRGAETALSRTVELTLAEGTAVIEASATDLAGRETRIHREVQVDLTGPVIGIYAPEPALVTAAEAVTVSGAAADASGITEVRFGSAVVFAEAGGPKRADWNALMPLRPGENSVVVSARDRAGNETHAQISVFRGDPATASAHAWRRQQLAGNRALLFAQDTDAAPGSLPEPEPAASGEIRLKTPLPDHPVRHNHAITVAGEVIAPEAVREIAINGRPVEPVTGAPRETFSRRVPIETDPSRPELEVPVQITARTASGGLLTREVRAAVRPVFLDAPESRMPVAALAFTGEGAAAGIAAELRAETETSLFHRGRFRVLDRMYLQSILTEQQLAAALADPNQAISLGRLTTAHAFLVAELFPRDAAGFEVKARAISTETSEILGIFDAFAEQISPDDIKRCAAAIAEQMEKRFPRLSGEVLATRGSEWLLNWTREDGIQPGAPILVVREEPPWIDEATGEVLSPPEYIPLGRGRVEQPGESATRARALEQPDGTVPIEKGMPVVSM